MPRSSTGHIVELKHKGGRVFALRFRAYGKRRYLTTDTSRMPLRSEDVTRQKPATASVGTDLSLRDITE